MYHRLFTRILLPMLALVQGAVCYAQQQAQTQVYASDFLIRGYRVEAKVTSAVYELSLLNPETGERALVAKVEDEFEKAPTLDQLIDQYEHKIAKHLGGQPIQWNDVSFLTYTIHGRVVANFVPDKQASPSFIVGTLYFRFQDGLEIFVPYSPQGSSALSGPLSERIKTAQTLYQQILSPKYKPKPFSTAFPFSEGFVSTFEARLNGQKLKITRTENAMKVMAQEDTLETPHTSNIKYFIFSNEELAEWTAVDATTLISKISNPLKNRPYLEIALYPDDGFPKSDRTPTIDFLSMHFPDGSKLQLNPRKNFRFDSQDRKYGERLRLYELEQAGYLEEFLNTEYSKFSGSKPFRELISAIRDHEEEKLSYATISTEKFSDISKISYRGKKVTFLTKLHRLSPNPNAIDALIGPDKTDNIAGLVFVHTIVQLDKRTELEFVYNISRPLEEQIEAAYKQQIPHILRFFHDGILVSKDFAERQILLPDGTRITSDNTTQDTHRDRERNLLDYMSVSSNIFGVLKSMVKKNPYLISSETGLVHVPSAGITFRLQATKEDLVSKQTIPEPKLDQWEWHFKLTIHSLDGTESKEEYTSKADSGLENVWLKIETKLKEKTAENQSSPEFLRRQMQGYALAVKQASFDFSEFSKQFALLLEETVQMRQQGTFKKILSLGTNRQIKKLREKFLEFTKQTRTTEFAEQYFNPTHYFTGLDYETQSSIQNYSDVIYEVLSNLSKTPKKSSHYKLLLTKKGGPKDRKNENERILEVTLINEANETFYFEGPIDDSDASYVRAFREGLKNVLAAAAEQSHLLDTALNYRLNANGCADPLTAKKQETTQK